jgi:hypothetical protein
MGPDTSAQTNQLDLQNQLQQQQLASENAVNAQVNTAVSPYLSGNQGYSAQQLSALTGSALDQNALRYNQAAQQTNAQTSARGENGLTPLSGVAASGYGNLQASKAGDLADSLRTVTLNNAQQANTNKFNAASILSGQGQTLAGNVGTFGSGASSSLNSLTTAQQGGFFNNFTKALGGAVGGAAGAAATGGAGTFASTLGSGNYGW